MDGYNINSVNMSDSRTRMCVMSGGVARKRIP